jgi:glucose/arabinose dehydrogenase
MARASTILFAILVAACASTAKDKPDPGPLPEITLESAFPSLVFEKPLYLCHDGVDESALYVTEQDGRVWRFINSAGTTTRLAFLDITERIPDRRHTEEGLLALAFHPDYKNDPRIFVGYSQHENDQKPRRFVISSFKAGNAGVDLASEVILFEITKKNDNHNGCTLAFGPDGYLYISLGDGGGAGDPEENAQNLATLQGSILRVDINDETYAIPPDNPFVGKEGARPEIWAYGLRNPWRMSFDSEGVLWVGDVGQADLEEVNIIVKGGNYGWDIREGSKPYEDEASAAVLIEPVAEYSHELGRAITGGYVYRGSVEALGGLYIYGDYVSGRIWGMHVGGDLQPLANELLGHFPDVGIASFGEDAAGELYVCDYKSGMIYRVTAVDS